MPLDAAGRTVSDDGRFWWSGSQWVPVNSLASAQQSGIPMYSVPGARTNSLAMGSAIVGAASWFLCPIVGALTAVVLGHMAKGEIRRTQEAGWGLATIGQVLGYAHLAIYGFLLLLFFSVCGGIAALSTFGAGH